MILFDKSTWEVIPLHPDNFSVGLIGEKLFDSELSDNQEAENKKWPFSKRGNEIDSFIKATGLYFNRTRGANCAWILSGASTLSKRAEVFRRDRATNFLRDAIVSVPVELTFISFLPGREREFRQLSFGFASANPETRHAMHAPTIPKFHQASFNLSFYLKIVPTSSQPPTRVYRGSMPR